MNETSSILLLSIVGIWLFTSQRGQAFISVLMSGSSSSSNGLPWDPNFTKTNQTTVPGIPKGSGLYPQEMDPNAPTGGKMA